MVSGFKNEFFNRIPLLDIEQQKSTESEPRGEDISDRKEGMKGGQKSPRPKKSKTVKKRQEIEETEVLQQPDEPKKKIDNDDASSFGKPGIKKGGVKSRFSRKAGNENEDPQQPTLTSTSDKKPLKINKSKKKRRKRRLR